VIAQKNIISIFSMLIVRKISRQITVYILIFLIKKRCNIVN